MNGSEHSLILLSFIAPLTVVFLFTVARWRRAGITLAPWSAVPALWAALTVPEGTTLQVPWLLLNLELGLTAAGKMFLLAAALVWLLSGLFAVSYLKDKAAANRFFISFLLAMCGNIGMILSRDVVGLYCFFTVMSFASYGLIIQSETREAYRAGKIYIILVIVGELLVFTGLALAASAAGTISLSAIPAAVAEARNRDIIIALIVLGFGIKAGALPLHVWLPLAHPVAPTPASAILSGSMIKAGLWGWIVILPFGQAALPVWGSLLVGFGLTAALYGVLVGITQQAPKTVLAYSSISQMGMMTILIGAGLLAPRHWPLILSVLLFYVIHHALAKAALFLSVGFPGLCAGRGILSWASRLIFILPVLSIAGLPYTSGALAKGALKYGTKKATLNIVDADILNIFLVLTTFGTALLLTHFVSIMVRGWKTHSGPQEARAGMILPWVILAGLSACLPYSPLASGLAGHVEKASSFLSDWHNMGLIAAAVASGLFVSAQVPNLIQIPAGDILSLYTRGADTVRNLGQAFTFRVTDLLEALRSRSLTLPYPWTSKSMTAWTTAMRCDTYLMSWPVFGLLFLTLMLLFLVVL